MTYETSTALGNIEPRSVHVDAFAAANLTDTEMLQKALLYAAANGIRDLIFSQRTYTIDGALALPSHIRLIGDNSTVTWTDPAGRGFSSFQVTEATNVEISGFRFVKGPGLSGSPYTVPEVSHAVKLERASNVLISNCYFEGIKSVAILGSSWITVEDSIFTRCRSAVYVDTPSGTQDGTMNTNLTFQGNHFAFIYREPIDLNRNAENVSITNNFFGGGSKSSEGAWGGDELLDIGGGITRLITVSDNIFDGLGTHHRAISVKSASESVVIERNKISGFVAQTDTSSVIAIGGGSLVTVQDNDISFASRAISVENSQVVISYNNFRGGTILPSIVATNSGMNLKILENEYFGDGWFSVSGAAAPNEIQGTNARDVLIGGRSADQLRGGAGADRLEGGAGNDRLEGGAEGDLLLGGDGADLLFGGDGNDLLAGGVGNDTLEGEAGDDLLLGEDGNDLLRGGAGNDTLLGGRGNDTIETGPGRDRADGGPGEDWLRAGADGGELRGGEGADTLESGGGPGTLLMGGIGGDTYIIRGLGERILEEPGAGVDTVLADLAGGSYALPVNVEVLVLLGGAVTGIGNAASNRLVGNATGNLLSGGAAQDTLEGLGGDDTLFGGQGQDVFVFRPNEGRDTVRDFTPGEDILLFTAGAFASASAALAAARAGPSGLEVALPGGVVVLEGIGALRLGDVLIG